MSTNLYFCGELVADFIEREQGSGNFELLLGGFQFHGARGAAIAVAREQLPYHVFTIGPISKDHFGDRFVKEIRASGADTCHATRVDLNTTVAVVSIRPGQENAFNFYGQNTADQMVTIGDLPESLGDSGDQNVFCFGSIASIMEPSGKAWLAYAKQQRDHALVIYDLNTRPAIARDPGQYRQLVLEWARTAHVMKASDADLRWAYPDADPKDVAAEWLAAGASLAVVTFGPTGAVAYTKTSHISAEASRLIAHNTIGAGDNFNAGLAIYLAKNDCLTADDICGLSERQLFDVLCGANHTASRHLRSLGASRDVAAWREPMAPQLIGCVG